METTSETQSADLIAGAPALPDGFLRKAKRIMDRAAQQSDRDKTAFDKYVRQYQHGILQTEVKDGAQNWVSANQVFPYVNVLVSLLYHQNPSIEVVPRLESGASDQAALALVNAGVFKTTDEARQHFAETLQQVLTYSYGEGQSEVQNNACLFESLVRGLGWAKTTFDPVRGIDRTDTLRRDEVYIDPHARCDIAQARYAVQTCVLPLEEAEELFAALGYGDALKANYILSEGKSLEAEKAKLNDPATEKDCFKFFEMWCKEGTGRYVDYFDAVTRKHLMRRNWPFMLDYDEFPFQPLAFNKQYTQVCDAFPDLQVVESLWRLYEYLIEYFNRHVRRSIAKKIIYDGDVFSEDMITQLKDPQDMRFVKADRLNGRDVKSAIQLLEFNSSTDTAADLAKSVRQIAETILGLDEIQKGGIQSQKEITATHAEILDEYGRLRMGRRQKIMDEWLTRQVRCRAQVIRQLMTPEKVNLIAGPKAAFTWAAFAYSPEDLIGEYTIGIQAGSAGERAKREKLRQMIAIYEKMKEANVAANAPVYDLVAYLREMIRAEGEKKPERYETPPQEAQAPTNDAEKFQINGASVEGLFKLMYPPGGEPLISWDEGRGVVAASLGVDPNAPIPPQTVNTNAPPVVVQQPQQQGAPV